MLLPFRNWDLARHNVCFGIATVFFHVAPVVVKYLLDVLYKLGLLVSYTDRIHSSHYG